MVNIFRRRNLKREPETAVIRNSSDRDIRVKWSGDQFVLEQISTEVGVNLSTVGVGANGTIVRGQRDHASPVSMELVLRGQERDVPFHGDQSTNYFTAEIITSLREENVAIFLNRIVRKGTVLEITQEEVNACVFAANDENEYEEQADAILDKAFELEWKDERTPAESGELAGYKKAAQLGHPVAAARAGFVLRSLGRRAEASAYLTKRIHDEVKRRADDKDPLAIYTMSDYAATEMFGHSKAETAILVQQAGIYKKTEVACLFTMYAIAASVTNPTAASIEHGERGLKLAAKYGHVKAQKILRARAANIPFAEEFKEEGNTFFKNGKFAEAIKKYKSATEINPNVPVYWSNMAACYEKLGIFESMEEASRSCIMADRNFIKGYFRLAVAQKQLQQLEACIKTLESGLAVDSSQKDLKQMKNDVTELLRAEKEGSVAEEFEI